MGRRAGLGGITVQELHRELRRRQRRVGTLARRRDRLARNLSVLEAEISALGGPAGSMGGNGVRHRPKNATNLVEALAKVLDGKTMSVTDVAEAVQKAGYRTTSPSFRTIVNQTLINNNDRFKRVSRGQYTAK